MATRPSTLMCLCPKTLFRMLTFGGNMCAVDTLAVLHRGLTSDVTCLPEKNPLALAGWLVPTNVKPHKSAGLCPHIHLHLITLFKFLKYQTVTNGRKIDAVFQDLPYCKQHFH
ncbi:hypothetical protein CGRA01v4_13065 [Colletotrichum graminicola]|nr:hypothetical protein CGRA01v4_13065 [Colletotrichum graminicola]